MERYPLIQRWGDNQSLNILTDSRGVKYVPVTKIAYMEVVESDSDPEVPEWSPPELHYPPSYEGSPPDRGVTISRPAFNRTRPTVYNRYYDFEIPRPTFTPERPRYTPSRHRRILTVKVNEPRDIPAPAPRIRFSHDRYTQTSRPSSIREPRGYWSLLSPDNQLPPNKPKFRYKNLGIYPPRRDPEGLIGKKRQLIHEAITSSEPGFEFYGRNSFNYNGRVSPHPIFLPGKKFSRPDTPPPLPEMPFVRTVTPYHTEYHFRSPTPPLPERRYHETDLEPSTSAVNAFTPFEGQIASRNRSSVLARWQDTLTRPTARRHAFSNSYQKLFDIEENPDY